MKTHLNQKEYAMRLYEQVIDASYENPLRDFLGR